MYHNIITDWKRTLYDPDSQQLIDGARSLLELIHHKSISLILIDAGGEQENLATLAQFVNQDRPEETLIISDRVHSEIEMGNQLHATTLWLRQGKFAAGIPLTEGQQPTLTMYSLEEVSDFLVEVS